ncbi:MAG: hypothetical protein KQJ78_23135 [Deltaproteobacteria bacterium]|nr:hypothetical protein [Deltaproteobacteria bacterium]
MANTRIIYQDGDYQIICREDGDGRETHHLVRGEVEGRLPLVRSTALTPALANAIRKQPGADPSGYYAVGTSAVIRRAAAPAWDAEVKARADWEAANAWCADYDRLRAAVDRAESASYYDPARIIRAKMAVTEYLDSHPEVAERLRAERAKRGKQHHWGYSEEGVQRALRGED